MSAERAHLMGRAGRGRRRVATAVVAAATVSGLALTATPAFADGASPLGIGRAVTDTQQRGTFSVPVWSDDDADAVASVSAVIRDGDTPVGDPIPLVQAVPTSAQTWTLPSDGLLELTEDGGRMPHLGTYAIDITATDAGGATLTRTDAGTLDFTLIPRIKPLASSPATVDLLHRDVSVSGTLVGVQPGSGDEVPLAGRDVTVQELPDYTGAPGDTATVHTTTDDGGAFSTPAFTIGQLQRFRASYTADTAGTEGSSTADFRPQYAATPVTVLGNADHSRVLPCRTFKVSGVVVQGYDAPPTAPVVANAPVEVSLGYCDGGNSHPVFPAVTDATGHYTVTVTADPECDGNWTVSGGRPFTSQANTVGGYVAFPDYSMFSGVSSSIAADGTVTVTGKLLRTYHRSQLIYGQNTSLWYSRDGKTGWTRLKAVNTDAYGAFKLVAYGYVDGYYQVRHLDTDKLVGSSGPVVRLTRIDTRIPNLRASATRVRKSTVITVGGTLQQWTSGAWRAYGGQHVELYFLPKGSKTWQYKGSGTTASSGWTSFRPKATADGYWLIQYFGDARHFDSGAKPVYVDVI